MTIVRTHYDNLKVSRDAPPEVIKAAYKSLAQRYHPDRNPGDKDAERVMQLINASYDILSDSAKRAQHDRWIAQQEQHNLLSAQASTHRSAPHPSMSPSRGQAAQANNQRAAPPLSFDLASLVGQVRPVYTFLIIGYVLWSIFSRTGDKESSQPTYEYKTRRASAHLQPNRALTPDGVEEDSPATQPPSKELTSFSSILKEMEQTTAMYGMYSDIVRARRTGMHDDMLYQELICSKKWKSKLESWQAKSQMNDVAMVKKMGLKLTNTPDYLKQAVSACPNAEQNFFDHSRKSDEHDRNEDLVRAFVDHSSMVQSDQQAESVTSEVAPKPEAVVQEIRGKSEDTHHEQLIGILYARKPYPSDIEGDVKRLKARGVEDRMIYHNLYTNPPFHARMVSAHDSGFSDLEIASLFGLTLSGSAQMSSGMVSTKSIPSVLP